MYGYSPKNKEERLKLREFYLAGYTAKENAAADCVIATAEENGRYLLRIFDGTASKPCVNYYYRTAEARQREIDRHVENRAKIIADKEARKQAKNAAGAYVVDLMKPHFEPGQLCTMEYYSDDPWPHTTSIRIIKRTACFVTIAHVHGDREEKPQRVKVSVDQNGEYLSWGSFYYFRAPSCPDSTAEETQEVHTEQETPTQSTQEAKFLKEQEEGRTFIKETVARYPLKDGGPVVTIHWGECPAFYGWEDNELKLSVAAAELIFQHFDNNDDKDGWCYYKTKFTVDAGEQGEFTDRYDFGDLNGGLIAHIRRYKAALADYLEAYTAAGRVVSVTVAPWVEKALKARREAAQRHMKETMETLELLTDEQLTAAVLISPKDQPNVARFFLQELSRRDAGKALKVLRAWKEGLGPGDIDRIA